MSFNRNMIDNFPEFLAGVIVGAYKSKDLNHVAFARAHLDHLDRVLKRSLEKWVGDCTCHDDYTSRKRKDPSCFRCEFDVDSFMEHGVVRDDEDTDQQPDQQRD